MKARWRCAENSAGGGPLNSLKSPDFSPGGDFRSDAPHLSGVTPIWGKKKMRGCVARRFAHLEPAPERPCRGFEKVATSRPAEHSIALPAVPGMTLSVQGRPIFFQTIKTRPTAGSIKLHWTRTSITHWLDLVAGLQCGFVQILAGFLETVSLG